MKVRGPLEKFEGWEMSQTPRSDNVEAYAQAKLASTPYSPERGCTC